MTFFDTFIYFLFILRFSSIIFGIIISYHKKIISNDPSIEKEKKQEEEHHKEKIISNSKIKKVLDFLFTILFAILIFILFRPGDKKGVVLDIKTNILLKIAAISLMINADWDSFYLFIHPHVRKFERNHPI